MRPFAAALVIASSLLLVSAPLAHAQDAPKPPAKADSPSAAKGGGCDAYAWDVSHELDVLGKPAKSIAAGTDGKAPVHIDLDQHYTVKLAPQNAVHFAVKPAKARSDDDAHAGVLAFRTLKPGRYRVSLTTGHWLDVVDGELIVVSSQFQGQRGCEKAHKIVQFELSGNRNFVLQLSGGAEASVGLALTQVKAD
jgi:hypothetical protein